MYIISVPRLPEEYVFLQVHNHYALMPIVQVFYKDLFHGRYGKSWYQQEKQLKISQLFKVKVCENLGNPQTLRATNKHTHNPSLLPHLAS